MKTFKEYLEEELLVESPNLRKDVTKLPANIYVSPEVVRSRAKA